MRTQCERGFARRTNIGYSVVVVFGVPGNGPNSPSSPGTGGVYLCPEAVAPLNVTTSIGEDGSVSVTVCDTGEDYDQPPPFSTLALEELARQSATTAISAWVTLHGATDDDTG